MTVTTVFADTADDGICSGDDTFATANTGGADFFTFSGVSQNNANAVSYSFDFFALSSHVYELYESFLSFDTSAIADSDVVSAVVLSLFGDSGAFGHSGTANLEAREYDFGASVTTADWRTSAQLGALTRYATFAIAGWSDTSYNAFTADGTHFNTATNIKTGNVRMVMTTDYHVAGSAPDAIRVAGWLTADNTGTTNDPKLAITSSGGASGGPMFTQVIDYRAAKPLMQRAGESLFSFGAQLMTAPSIPGNFAPAGLERLARPFMAVKSETWFGVPDPLLTAPAIPGNFLPVYDLPAKAPRQRPSDPQNNTVPIFAITPIPPAGAQVSAPLANKIRTTPSETWYGMPVTLLTAPDILPAGVQASERRQPYFIAAKSDVQWGTPVALLTAPAISPAGVQVFERLAQALRARPSDGQGSPLVAIAVVGGAGMQVYDRNAQPARFRPVDAPQPAQSTLLLLVPPIPAGNQVFERLARAIAPRPSDGPLGAQIVALSFVPPIPAGIQFAERLARALRARPSDGPLGMPENIMTAPAVRPAGVQFWQMPASRLRPGPMWLAPGIVGAIIVGTGHGRPIYLGRVPMEKFGRVLEQLPRSRNIERF